VLYRHKQTGAEVLSVVKDDDNKVFGITFRTPPEDSTGIPHILEHSVLCGSDKFPTKDPFVTLLKGSLQTFLNAFTYPDRTCYPVASQNSQDFYNLVDVYMDAVFHPRAISDPLVMAQEGWHYELESKDEPLTYKGVVFNEMKGVYSSPDSVFGREVQQALFPDNAYGVDSGGDPTVIPQLSFEQFQQFHSSYYHPTNSRIFFYGDDPVDTRLNIVDDYLSSFEAKPVARAESQVQWQPKRSTPWSCRTTYPCSAEEVESGSAKLYSSVNWLVNDGPLSPKDEVRLSALKHTSPRFSHAPNFLPLPI
jgi:Zn-dependent M16 (insulinase) family peptidase